MQLLQHPPRVQHSTAPRPLLIAGRPILAATHHVGVTPTQTRAASLGMQGPTHPIHAAGATSSAVMRGRHAHQQQAGRRGDRVVARFMDGGVYAVPEGEEEEGEGRTWNPATLTAAVVGAGPVGITAALYLAKRGYRVHVFERQPSRPCHGDAASWPLELTGRGTAAVQELGLQVPSINGPAARPLQGVWSMAAPSSSAPSSSTPAAAAAAGGGPSLQQIDTSVPTRLTHVVDRSGFASELIDEAERLYPDRITVHYGAELSKVDFKKRVARLLLAPAAAAASAASAATSRQQEQQQQLAAGASGSKTSGSVAVAEPPVVQPQQPQQEELEFAYDLLVGADGVDSTVRKCMQQSKLREFYVQQPITEEGEARAIAGLPLPSAASGAALPPGLSEHAPQSYLYRYEAPGAPTVLLWRCSDAAGAQQGGPFAGSISGVTQWDEAALADQLRTAYPGMPAEWTAAIARQTCAPGARPARRPCMVQCTQYHAPRTVLLGDAAHATTTGATGQGPSAGIESVRTLALVLRGSGDDLGRSPEVYSNVRHDAIGVMQFLEFVKATSRPAPHTVKYSSWIFSISAALSRAYLALCGAVAAAAHFVAPRAFVTLPQLLGDSLRDRRTSFADVGRMLTTYGAPPVVAVVLGCFYFLLRAVITSPVLA